MEGNSLQMNSKIIANINSSEDNSQHSIEEWSDRKNEPNFDGYGEINVEIQRLKFLLLG
jgi:hypothetical protein